MQTLILFWHFTITLRISKYFILLQIANIVCMCWINWFKIHKSYIDLGGLCSNKIDINVYHNILLGSQLQMKFWINCVNMHLLSICKAWDGALGFIPTINRVKSGERDTQSLCGERDTPGFFLLNGLYKAI